MISYKTVNILLVFVSLLLLVFYYDTQETNAKDLSFYSILYILYLTHVCGVLFNIDNKLHIIIIVLGIITFITYLLSRKLINPISNTLSTVTTSISKFFTNNTSLPIKTLGQAQIFDVSHIHGHFTVDFMIYVDAINKIKANQKINLLTLNQCPIIQYNSTQNTYDLVQYNCNSDQKYSVPIKYTKWTRFHVEFVKGKGNKPLYIGLKIDNDLVYTNKIFNIDYYADENDPDENDPDENDTNIKTITVGYNSITNDSSIGFVKNILIGGT